MAYPPGGGGGGGGREAPFPLFFQHAHAGSSSHYPASAGIQRPAVPEFDISGPFRPLGASQFDILEWYPHYQSCVRYFLDHAQHDGPIRAMAAFINIELPFQRSQHPMISSKTGVHSPSGAPSPSSTSAAAGKLPMPGQSTASVSLTPYVRRLVATGFDFPGILHGFFGDNWVAGIGHLREVERRNYLFAAKSSNWLRVKSTYDMPNGQLVPFLRPLQEVTEKEIVAAESTWSEWLAMQDWMIGPRNPDVDEDMSAVVKNEEDE